MASPAYTTHFQLPIPHAGDVNFAGTLLDWFAQAETTLGCNTNLIVTGDTDEGIATRLHLGYLAGEDQVQDADPGDGRWGRVVLQQTIADGTAVLGRLVGLSDVLGLEPTAAFGQTIYHHASAGTLTVEPESAVVIGDDGRLLFLPMGFAYDNGDRVFLNGLLPVQACPTIANLYPVAFADGGNNPIGTWVEAFETGGPTMTVAFSGAGQDLDLVVPFALPADFLEFPSLDGDDYFALKASFKTTGAATLRVYSVIDSDGDEHIFAAVGTASTSDFSSMIVAMAQLASLDATWTPGTTIYFKLKAEGDSPDTVKVRTWSLLQYFPWVAWYT